MSLIDSYLLIFFFLAIASIIIFLSRQKQNRNWKFFLFANLLFVILGGGLFYLKSNNIILTLLADWLPLLLIFFFYQTAGLLSRAFHNETFDNHIIALEKKWFGINNPTIRLSEIFNFYWLSEWLHLCYLSYFFLLYGVPLYFFLKHEYVAFYHFEFAELLILLPAFLTHSIVPVLSPRTLFEKIQQPMCNGAIYRVTHLIVESGSADGTAFPSTHVAIGTFMLLMALHMHTTFFFCIALLATGLIICTVYGRFHYVVDMLSGMFYGCVVFVVMYC